jgi:hypothetical protein
MDLWTSADFEGFSALVWLGAAVEEHGLESPSLRTIARGRCSPGTLLNWFGRKPELERRVVRALGVKWGFVLTSTLVPGTEEERFYARLRLAYDDLARNDAAVAGELAELEVLEREIIAWWLRSTHGCTEPDVRVVTVVHALLVRLWDVRVHPDPRAALALLEEVVNVLVGDPVLERPYLRGAG